jgi:hypothetical protein
MGDRRRGTVRDGRIEVGPFIHSRPEQSTVGSITFSIVSQTDVLPAVNRTRRLRVAVGSFTHRFGRVGGLRS